MGNFCKEGEGEIVKYQLDEGNYKVSDRKASLSDSIIAFHSSHFTNLKHFYLFPYLYLLQTYFAGLVSYNRFVKLEQRVAVAMMPFLKMHCLKRSRGINFIDYTHIKVCHDRRDPKP